jgi:hypothetical protein
MLNITISRITQELADDNAVPTVSGGRKMSEYITIFNNS